MEEAKVCVSDGTVETGRGVRCLTPTVPPLFLLLPPLLSLLPFNLFSTTKAPTFCLKYLHQCLLAKNLLLLFIAGPLFFLQISLAAHLPPSLDPRLPNWVFSCCADPPLPQLLLMSDPGNMRCAHPPTSQHWHYFPQIPRKPQPSSNSVKIPLLGLAAKLVIDWIYDWNILDDQFSIFREPCWNLRPIAFCVPHLISVLLVMQKQK